MEKASGREVNNLDKENLKFCSRKIRCPITSRFLFSFIKVNQVENTVFLKARHFPFFFYFKKTPRAREIGRDAETNL